MFGTCPILGTDAEFTARTPSPSRLSPSVLKAAIWRTACTVVRLGGMRMQSSESPATKKIKDRRSHAADLHWLAFLLTGQRDTSIDIAADAVAAQSGEASSFNEWMRAWARRIVIAKALTTVRVELAESVRRTRRAKLGLPPASVAWSLSPSATKARIEDALLAIDILPRTVVVLCLFEGIRAADAAIALDVDSPLVRKALAIGVRDLVANLARGNDSATPLRTPGLRLAPA
jgi:DNA-directed RNA polymerase specialized sigma24 family protein